MKLTGQAIDRFLKSPDPKTVAVLIYGPEPGLIHDRMLSLTAAYGGAGAEGGAFTRVDLNGDEVAKDPARLADAAASMTLMGGAQVIRLREAGDNTAKACAAMLEAPVGENRVIVTAGDLGPRSALRRLFEGAVNAAALPCYAEEAGALAGFIAGLIQEAGKRIGREAAAEAAQRLTGDRTLARREVEKLLLYAGNAGEVTLDHVVAVVGDEAAIGFDDAVLAAADGNFKAADRALSKLWAEDTSGIAILRALQRHLDRLYAVRLEVEAGGEIGTAIKQLRPPVFFKQTAAFERQVNRLTAAQLGRLIDRAMEAEAQCKETGMPERALTERAFWAVAHAAGRGVAGQGFAPR